MPISGEIYRQLGRASAGAIAVVAAYDHEQSAIIALTVSSFVTLSFDPPLVMFAIQHDTASYASMVTSKSFGVSLLAAEQAEVAHCFANQGRRRVAAESFERGPNLQVPLIPAALAQIECLTHELFISGDHAIVVGMVEGVHTRDGQPLLYFSRQYGGFTPLSGA
jgi:3-hydroxy-9,10-secoandrosta-1,3,5(10)-triene-9,17-dione monooxygenase reductase component